jgi:hypothetical protein
VAAKIFLLEQEQLFFYTMGSLDAVISSHDTIMECRRLGSSSIETKTRLFGLPNWPNLNGALHLLALVKCGGQLCELAAESI